MRINPLQVKTIGQHTKDSRVHMTASGLHKSITAVTMVVMLVSIMAVSVSAAAAAGVAWQVSLVAQPTNLPLTAHHVGEPHDQYALVLTNTGSVESTAPVTLIDTLPAGVTVHGGIEGSGWGCSTGGEGSIVECSYSAGIPALAQSMTLTIPVAVTMAGVLTSTVAVSGGGAPTVLVSRSTQAGAPAPTFGFLDFNSRTSDTSGLPDINAGDHPFALTTTFDFPQVEAEGRPERPVQLPRSMQIDLPAGLVGNPLAAPRCRMIDVAAGRCQTSSRVGTLLLNYGQLFLTGEVAYPIYNVVPERGYPAEFGVDIAGIRKSAFMYASVTAPEYGVHVSIPDSPQAAQLTNAIATFFGDPQTMDGGKNAPVPFLTNPGDCSGASLTTKVQAVSWEEPEHPTPPFEALAPAVAGCDLLRFQPAVMVTPHTTLADEPTGYTVDLEIPQSQSNGLEGRATPDLKDARVTLPQGVSISPGAADGLEGCSATQIDLPGTEIGSDGQEHTAPGHCPLASQIGSVEVETPLLEKPLKGGVFVGTPECDPCSAEDASAGRLFKLYLEINDPTTGVIIKLPGTASVNPSTGQITTSFKNAPQLPFTDLKIKLKDGPRAPLSNPQNCGEALTTSDMTPWSSPQTPDATPSWAFNVTGCEGSSFAPSFDAGTTNPAAGSYTSFTTTFGRSDRQQDLGVIQAQTPVGLLGMLSHVTLCGEPQAASGTCSSASQIGRATAGVGAGSHPFWASGPVFLTGPYQGAPFGLSIPIVAKAGPFNLGTVVTRAMLNINPDTSAITITSDPLPQILDGVPLRVQTVNVTVDRPQFIFNPTNCEAKQVTATLASVQGATAHVSSPFAAGGCRNLPFKPAFKVSTQARTSKANGASLTVKVLSSPGQANIAKVDLQLPKALPARLTTLQKACTEAQFNANPAGCPAASVIGMAKAITPVLNVPLVGPAFLVSHGGAAFPDVEFILQGQGVRIDLDGKTLIKKGVTFSRFETVPDAPISSFETILPQGPHSVLATNIPAKANGNLCSTSLQMPTMITAQNGAVVKQNTKISVTGCPKAKKKAKTAKKTRNKKHK